MQLTINCPGSCPGQPDPVVQLLERIMSTLEELQAKVDSQTEQVTALRAYVTEIEIAVRDLSSGQVLSTVVQERINAIVAKIDANNAEIAAAGDRDIAT